MPDGEQFALALGREPGTRDTGDRRRDLGAVLGIPGGRVAERLDGRAASTFWWPNALDLRPAKAFGVFDNVLRGHVFFKSLRSIGEGGAIGPDITGSQRANLDYLLENLLDPNAVVPREYQVTIFTTTSGRTISGLVKEESDRAVTIQAQNEIVILPKNEIEQRTASKLSMMPEGVLEQMSIEEARALVAYLGRSTPMEKK